MRLPWPPLVEARLLRRENRFRAAALMGGEEVAVHVPNSGRLQEAFSPPGRRAWLAKASNPHRKTAYDLVLVEGDGGILFSADARVPNRLFPLALKSGACREWLGDAAQWQIQPEPRLGEGRADFLLTAADGRRWWVETKSVTLVEDGIALFPDAPTARGRRHLAELCKATQAGDRAAIVFVVQRADARSLTPHEAVDAAFGEALRRAAACGVAIHAYRCQVTLSDIAWGKSIPVHLTPHAHHPLSIP